MKEIEKEKEELFAELRKRVEYLNNKVPAAKDNILQEIICYGFVKWLGILCKAFPGFEWKAENTIGLDFMTYKRFLFEIFFTEIALKIFNSQNREEREQLKEEGWKEYLKGYYGEDERARNEKEWVKIPVN